MSDIINFKAKPKSMPKANLRIKDTIQVEGLGSVGIELLREKFVFSVSVGYLVLLIVLDDNYKETQKVRGLRAFNMAGENGLLLLGIQPPVYALDDLDIDISDIVKVCNHVVGKIVREDYDKYINAVMDDTAFLPSIEANAKVVGVDDV